MWARNHGYVHDNGMVISVLDSGGPSKILARCKTTSVASFSLRSQNLTVLFKGMITLGNSSATNSVVFLFV